MKDSRRGAERLARRGVGMTAAAIAVLTVRAVAAMPSAQELLQRSGVRGGLVVHVGCGEGRLTAGLRASESYLVHGLNVDPRKVERAREHIRKLGLYGEVSADVWDGGRLPYIDNLVNLIVVTDGGPRVSKDEMMRVLVPGGVAIAGGRKTVKPRPDDMDEWTHWLHGPGNNAVSSDRKVGISRSLQWIAPPLWGRHHNLLPSVSAMVSAGGRVFYIIDEAPVGVKGPTDRWSLLARDAFNGLALWRRPIRSWGWRQWSKVQFGGVMRFKGPDQIFRRLVAVGDTVYVTLGFREPVVAVDGATGKTTHVYRGTEDASEILFSDGLLLLTRNAPGGTPGKNVLAVDADTGRILWERKGYTGVTSRGDELKAYTDAYLTAGDDKVFFLDRENIVALDMRSGEEAWKRPRPETKKGVLGHYAFNFAHFCTLVYHDGMLFLGQINPTPTNLNRWQEKDMVILAMDASSGKELWRHTGMTLAHFTPPDLFVSKGLVWTMKKKVVSLCGLDARTGAVKKEYPVKGMLVGHHHRCYRNKATERYYLAGEEGIEYIDFDSGELDVHHWLRGACAYGLMPANGLIYMPTHACGCHANVKLNGFFALNSRNIAPRSERGPRGDGGRLEKGPAYGKVSTSGRRTSDTSTDWPVFKHDNRRSNHVATSIPSGLS